MTEIAKRKRLKAPRRLPSKVVVVIVKGEKVEEGGHAGGSERRGEEGMEEGPSGGS